MQQTANILEAVHEEKFSAAMVNDGPLSVGLFAARENSVPLKFCSLAECG